MVREEPDDRDHSRGDLYECVECGNRIQSEESPGDCPVCGGRLLDITTPRE